VEGYEERLLRGGAKTLADSRPLVHIELNPVTLEKARSSVERVVDLLRSHGYALFAARRAELVPLERLPRGRDYVNCFALHPDRPARPDPKG
jgi:hypothetical protein